MVRVKAYVCGSMAGMSQPLSPPARVGDPGVPGRIVVEGLSKSFGSVHAVRNLTFTVEPGSVTGFLGPNGAGKTTTLRMLLGLVHPTAGTATIGGQPYGAIENPTVVVGAALEAASFHPGRTARNHLRVYCAAAGLPDARADEVLEMVGLGGAASARCAGSPWVCGNASVWPAPCSATRGCSSSTSRPTASTRREFAGCAASSGTWPVRAGPSWCRVTCSTRSRRSPTGWSS